MKAIILASGSGTRFEPLSINNPKPLFTFLGKSIIEHNLDSLIGIVDEVVVVIGYLGENIKNRIGDYYKGIKISYIWDKQIIGTGNSAKIAIDNIEEGKFILLNGDDIYSREDVEKVINNFPCMLAKEVSDASGFGVLNTKDGKGIDIEEKPKKPKTNLINAGFYFLPKKIFNNSIKKSQRGEYEFTDYIKLFIKENDLNYVKAENWSPASYPWDLFCCAKIIFRTFNFRQKGVIEPNVTLKGRISIGENTLIKSGVYIEGPVYIGKNCTIGPNAYIREGSIIEDNVSIGQGVEVKNSIIGTRTKINHLSYVGDSIIGSDCNFGAGTIVTNLRHDNKNIQTIVKGEMIDTKKRKLGVIMGDNVKTGANTIFYPGRKIWPNKFTKPGEQVTKNIS